MKKIFRKNLTRMMSLLMAIVIVSTNSISYSAGWVQAAGMEEGSAQESENDNLTAEEENTEEEIQGEIEQQTLELSVNEAADSASEENSAEDTSENENGNDASDNTAEEEDTLTGNDSKENAPAEDTPTNEESGTDTSGQQRPSGPTANFDSQVIKSGSNGGTTYASGVETAAAGGTSTYATGDLAQYITDYDFGTWSGNTNSRKTKTLTINLLVDGNDTGNEQITSERNRNNTTSFVFSYDTSLYELAEDSYVSGEKITYGDTTSKTITIKLLSKAPSITITGDHEVFVGKTTALTAAVANSDAEVSWSSSDESIATVDANGVVTGAAAGSVTITATITEGTETYSDTIDLEVCAESITVTGKQTVLMGQTSQLTAAVAIADSDKSVTWSSSDESIATVDQNGLVTAGTTAAGTVTITATSVADGQIYGTLDVTVKEAEKYELTVNNYDIAEGSVTVNGSEYADGLEVFEGQDVNLVFTPQDGYALKSVTMSIGTALQDITDLIGNDGTYTIAADDVTNDIELTVEFAQIGLHIEIIGEGTVTVKSSTTSSGTYTEVEPTEDGVYLIETGRYVELTMLGDTGFAVSKLYVNNGANLRESITSDYRYTFAKPTDMTTVRVYFSENVTYDEFTGDSPNLSWRRSAEPADGTNFPIALENLTWTWDDVKDIETPLSDIEDVWDASFTPYFSRYLGDDGKADHYSATWKTSYFAGTGYSENYSDMRRFRAEFSLPEGFTTGDYIGLTSINQEAYANIANGGRIIPINDNIFVFVYKEGDINSDNYTDYLAFWTGTSNQSKYNVQSFHGVEGTVAVRATDPNSTAGWPACLPILEAVDGWYAEAELDNLGANLFENYPDATSEDVFIIDVFIGDMSHSNNSNGTDDSQGGGTDALKLNFVKAGAALTINYYKGSVSESNFLGTEHIKDNEFGTQLSLTSEQLSAYKSQAGSGYQDGIQIPANFIVSSDSSKNIINVVYPTETVDVTVEYYTRDSEDDTTPTLIYTTTEEVPKGTAYAALAGDLETIGDTHIAASVRDDYDNGVLEDPDGTVSGTGEVIKAFYTKQLRNTSLTYDANGGTGTVAAAEGIVGETVTVAANAFTRTGYTFTGWNTAANGEGTSYAEGADYTLAADGNVLYAQWSRNTADFDAAGFEVVYDGLAHQITFTGTLAAGEEVQYKVGTNEWTAAVPTYTNMCNESVAVRVVNGDTQVWNKTVAAVINPKEITVTGKNATYTYD